MGTTGHPFHLPQKLVPLIINHRHEAIPGFPWKEFKDFILGELFKLKIFHKRKVSRFASKADSPLKKTWGLRGIDGITIKTTSSKPRFIEANNKPRLKV